MPASAPRPARLSKEEWLELENQTGSCYEYLDGFVHAIAQPCFTLEVLFPSTADKDRREKLEAHFETYALISQEEKRVEVYQRTCWSLVWSEVVNDRGFKVRE